MTREEAIKTIEIAIAEGGNQHPCIGCKTGWGQVNENGVISCMEACEKVKAYMTQQEAEENKPMKTTWETPESCPHCMEHLSKDWAFCPECGRPTDWSKNDPLTLEELREMDREPVWVKVIDHDVFADKTDDFDDWGLVRKSWVRILDGRRADLVHIDYDFEDYGKEWLAYRHKPKEETT